MNKKVIVSLTSYGLRLKYVSKTIFSVLSGTFKDVHIVLTIAKKDKKFIPNELQLLIDTNVIELLEVDVDLGPHTKYFYTMKKYKNTPIITIDDDGVYDPKLVESLYKKYTENYDCICARRVHRILFNDKVILNYRKWIFDYNKEKKQSMFLLATGVGGVLYPPNILDISVDNLEEINKCFYADDIYLKVLEIRKNIPVIWVENNWLQPKPFSKEIDKQIKENGLWRINTLKDRNDDYIKTFINDFNRLR